MIHVKRKWTCRKCRKQHANTRLRYCPSCKTKRPARRKPAHMVALEVSYEDYVKLNGGEHCGICGAHPKPGKRLQRDHDHRRAIPRGLLCFRCNAALRVYMTLEWLRAAVTYLEKTSEM